MIKSVNLDNENAAWLDIQVKAVNMSYSAFLNQIIQQARGGKSIFDLRNNIGSFISEKKQENEGNKEAFARDAYETYRTNPTNFPFSIWTNEVAPRKKVKITEAELIERFKIIQNEQENPRVDV